MARVLIATGSKGARQRLRRLLDDRQGLEVIGFASSFAESARVIPEHRPDIVVMSESLSDVDGYEATRAIMYERPVPVVIVGDEKDDRRAFSVGAVTALAWPRGLRETHSFARIVRAMSEVRVVRRRDSGENPIPSRTIMDSRRT